MISLGDNKGIAELIDSMAKDVRALIDHAIEVAWYSRGSIQYETALRMSPLERDRALDFVSRRISAQQKAKIPHIVY